jgi:biotin operon repressor
MAETEDTQSNIAAIRTRLDNIEKMTRLSIAANPNSHAHIEGLFRRRVGSADLYMALADGPKSQEELTTLLGKSQPTISKIVTHLYESGLIDRLPQSGRVLWMWHDMERTLGISRVARRLVTKSTPKTGAAEQDTQSVSPD